MKNMIITVGAVILILTISGYQLKCNKMLHNKQNLKHAADEAAATASLYVDWKEYGEGNFVFDEDIAVTEGKRMLSLNLPGESIISQFYFESNNDSPRVRVWVKMGKLQSISEYEYLPN